MNIRKLINKLESIAIMCGEDQCVQIFCPDAIGWFGVSSMTYGGGDDVVRLYNDEDIDDE
jgi:hypothetical protein